MVKEKPFAVQENLISVIIPTLNEIENIQATLRAARHAYTETETEIILVDGGSTDGTLECIPKGIRVIKTVPNRAHQMNQGAAASRGEILVFCHGDTRLPPAWREAVLSAMADSRVSGGAFQSRLEPETKFLKWANRVKLPEDWRFMYGDQCLFVRRSLFESFNGYPVIPLMEDVEMARSMAQHGKLVRIDLRVTTDSRPMLEKGAFKQLIGNTWRMVRYLYLGASPKDIANTYHSSREESV